MFAVVGVWEANADVGDARSRALDGIVSGVRKLPGFVAGYWSDSTSDRTRSHTFIVFENADQADAFATRVRLNAEGQATVGIRPLSLDVVEVKASA